MQFEFRFKSALLCFFLSGFAALLYETTWTRQFHIVFGTSDLAVATVLAGYMAGLGLGAAIAGRLIDRVRRPVRVYGLLELGIALSALAVPSAIRAALALSSLLFGGEPELPESNFAIASFYLLCSFAILLVPTAMMGATLPLLARHCVHREEQIGSRVALLYGVNTLGAVFGTLAAGFALLPELGMFRTVLVGVGVNAAVFVIAANLARAAPTEAMLSHTPPPPAPQPRGASLVLAFIFASGAASFTYEVLWTRLLGHVLGGSVYAFATMLASFLTGIALGSTIVSRLSLSRERAALGFGVAQLGIAATSLVAFLGADWIAQFAGWLRVGGGSGLASQVCVAGLALLPSALFIGTTFPLAVRALARNEFEVGAVSARVYAWNTFGAILGAVGAGFWLIPALGYAGSMSTVVVLNLILCVATSTLVCRPAKRRLAALAGLGLIVLSVLRPPTPWSLLIKSPFDYNLSEHVVQRIELENVIYSAVGRSTTVLLFRTGIGYDLRTNGLPEATITRPHTLRLGSAWLSALPSLARPEASSLLVIGLGGGELIGNVPPVVQQIDVIELEEKVVEANRAIAAKRAHDPLSDPRVRVVVNDARSALALTDKRYDLIISQPSHPWTAGASHLYTLDFFELAREHLTPGGVFMQWIDLEFIDASLLRTLVASLAEAFPQLRVYHSNPAGTLFFLASDQPFDMAASVARAVAEAPLALSRVGVWGAEDVEFTLALDDASARAFSEGAELSTDDHNLLQSRSPRILRDPIDFAEVNAILRPFDPLLRADPRLDLHYVVERLNSHSPERAAQIAAASTDSDLKNLIVARDALRREDKAVLQRALSELMRRDPDGDGARRARAILARLLRSGLIAREASTLEFQETLDESGRAVVDGWRFHAEEDWKGLEGLEARLAAVHRHDPMYVYAMRLRVAWREFASVEQQLEALRLLQTELIADPNIADMLEYVSIAKLAGLDSSAFSALGLISKHFIRHGDPTHAAPQALALLQGLELDEVDRTLQRALDAQLRRL